MKKFIVYVEPLEIEVNEVDAQDPEIIIMIAKDEIYENGNITCRYKADFKGEE